MPYDMRWSRIRLQSPAHVEEKRARRIESAGVLARHVTLPGLQTEIRPHAGEAG